MTQPASVSRADVVAILAEYGNRPPDVVTERIDSLGVAWLVHEAERRFGTPLQLTDELLQEMTTVTGAVRVLRAAQDRSGPVDG